MRNARRNISAAAGMAERGEERSRGVRPVTCVRACDVWNVWNAGLRLHARELMLQI